MRLVRAWVGGTPAPPRCVLRGHHTSTGFPSPMHVSSSLVISVLLLQRVLISHFL